MAISKIIFNNDVMMNSTELTVNESTLVENHTAITSSGEKISGTLSPISGSISIAENGSSINVKNYSIANVSAPPIDKDVDGNYINGSIRSYSNSSITTLRDYAFCALANLSNVDCPNVEYIGASCFSGTNIQNANFPNCSYVGPQAFRSCYSLTSAFFPNITELPAIFYGCHSLEEAIFPKVNKLGAAFTYCSGLKRAEFPLCSEMSAGPFRSCYALSEISFPVCENIASYAFQCCSSLTAINMPKVKTVETQAFRECINLSNVLLPECSALLSTGTFSKCCNLLRLYLLSSTLCTLGSRDAFTSTPISTYTTSTGGVYGSIFVPASLYSSYITATNWAIYSSRFVSLSDEDIHKLNTTIVDVQSTITNLVPGSTAMKGPIEYITPPFRGKTYHISATYNRRAKNRIYSCETDFEWVGYDNTSVTMTNESQNITLTFGASMITISKLGSLDDDLTGDPYSILITII